MTSAGQWCLQHVPDSWFQLMTWATLTLEIAIPLLILGRVETVAISRSRWWSPFTVGCGS